MKNYLFPKIANNNQRFVKEKRKEKKKPNKQNNCNKIIMST